MHQNQKTSDVFSDIVMPSWYRGPRALTAILSMSGEEVHGNLQTHTQEKKFCWGCCVVDAISQETSCCSNTYHLSALSSAMFCELWMQRLCCKWINWTRVPHNLLFSAFWFLIFFLWGFPVCCKNKYVHEQEISRADTNRQANIEWGNLMDY